MKNNYIGCTCPTMICEHNKIALGSTWIATYQHVYRTAGFAIKGYPEPKKTHACLLGDHWCWKNAIENPFMAVKYLIYLAKKKYDRRKH